MAVVEWMREMRGSISFLLSLGSRGVRAPNWRKREGGERGARGVHQGHYTWCNFVSHVTIDHVMYVRQSMQHASSGYDVSMQLSML